MPKTFEQLQKEVADMQFGLRSEEDLAALFAPDPVVAPEPQPVAQPTPVVVEPTPQPQAPEPQPVTPAPEPVVEPGILDTLPEKFKGKDVQEALQKAVKSYTDLESDYKKQTDELAKLQGLVSSVANAPGVLAPTAPQNVRPNPTPQRPFQGISQAELDEVIPDSDYFERPGETITKKTRQEAFKIANEIAAQRILEYHDWMTRQMIIRDFRKDHSDFDSLKPDMIAIAQARPDIDQMPPEQSLPILYNFAKERQKIQIETMKKTLGIPEPVPQTTTTVQQPVDQEQLKAEIMAKLVAEIQKRKNASGITGAAAPVQPIDRAAPPVVAQPKTYAEEVFDRMLASGTKHPDDTLGLGTGVHRI